MLGTTEIIATAEAEPLASEMVCNAEMVRILKENGIDLGQRGVGYDIPIKGFHGIHSRWLVPPTVTSHKLALEAGRNLIEAMLAADPAFDVTKVRVVHGGSSSPDKIFPGSSNRTQGSLGIPAAFAEARDVSPGCHSAVDGLILLHRSLQCIAVEEKITTPLYGWLINGESIGSSANQPDSSNYLLWGCGATGLGARHTPGRSKKIGIRRTKAFSDGQFADLTESIGMGCDPSYLGLKPNGIMGEKGCYGREVQDYIRGPMVEQLKMFIASCEIDPKKNKAWLFGHNPTFNGAKIFGELSGFLDERVHTVAAERANTSSTSPIINYHDARKRQLINPGDHVFLVGYGTGMAGAFVYLIES